MDLQVTLYQALDRLVNTEMEIELKRNTSQEYIICDILSTNCRYF